MWNFIIVDKACCNLWRVVVAEALYAGNTNPHPECVNACKDKALFFAERKWSCIISLSPGCSPPAMMAYSRIQCFSLLMSYWVLYGGHHCISFGEWKPMLLSPYIASIPATNVTMFMKSLGNYRGGWKRLTAPYKMHHPVNFIVNDFLCWGHFFGELLHGKQIFLCSLPIERFIHILLQILWY